MSVFDDFDLILDYAHMWNWVPDWYLAQSIYKKFPESYSILTPFAYSYLEEMIRTTTSDYELPLFDRDKQPVKVSVGMALIALAIKENQNNPDYVALLEQAKRHFKYTQISIRFLYKGIIIKHNKTEPTYTKTSLFLCEKRRFFMARTEKGVVTTI